MPEVVLNVEMACSGCSGAVERVLKKLEGAAGVRGYAPGGAVPGWRRRLTDCADTGSDG
jgi:hypothetical protein